MGRRRTLPNINSPDWGIRMQAERQAVNFVVQGRKTDSAPCVCFSQLLYTFYLIMKAVPHICLQTICLILYVFYLCVQALLLISVRWPWSESSTWSPPPAHSLPGTPFTRGTKDAQTLLLLPWEPLWTNVYWLSILHVFLNLHNQNMVMFHIYGGERTESVSPEHRNNMLWFTSQLHLLRWGTLLNYYCCRCQTLS